MTPIYMRHCDQPRPHKHKLSTDQQQQLTCGGCLTHDWLVGLHQCRCSCLGWFGLGVSRWGCGGWSRLLKVHQHVDGVKDGGTNRVLRGNIHPVQAHKHYYFTSSTSHTMHVISCYSSGWSLVVRCDWEFHAQHIQHSPTHLLSTARLWPISKTNSPHTIYDTYSAPWHLTSPLPIGHNQWPGHSQCSQQLVATDI